MPSRQDEPLFRQDHVSPVSPTGRAWPTWNIAVDVEPNAHVVCFSQDPFAIVEERAAITPRLPPSLKQDRNHDQGTEYDAEGQQGLHENLSLAVTTEPGLPHAVYSDS